MRSLPRRPANGWWWRRRAPGSCGGPPCKFVIGVGEQAARLSRLFGREHAGAVIFEKINRHAGGRRRGIERPSQVLARVASANRQPMMGEHLVVERVDQRELLRKRRRALSPAGREVARHVSGKPGTTLRGAADHQRVGARGGERSFGVVIGSNVAIDDNRDRYCLLDRAHRRPVGASIVELTASTAMHRY